MSKLISSVITSAILLWGLLFFFIGSFSKNLEAFVSQKTSIKVSRTTVTPIYQKKRSSTPTNNTPTGDWGVAQKIGEHTYTIRVGQDDHMGTAREVVDALNNYRQTQGKGLLAWDDKLGSYAQQRADLFKQIGSTDAHAGFNDFLDNHNGFSELSFNRLGENSYFGGPLFAVHLIEWVFAKSPEHNANQLDAGWSHVGIGVTDTAVDLVFGGGKI